MAAADAENLVVSKFISHANRVPELNKTELDAEANKILAAFEADAKKIRIGRASPSIPLP